MGICCNLETNNIKEFNFNELDTFIVDRGIRIREGGNYISSVKDTIEAIIKKRVDDAIIDEYRKKQTNNNDNEFKFEEIQKFHICSENQNKQIYNFGHCPMLFGLYHCYGCHEHIILSPDDFWLMIAQSFSVYVNFNSERLRKYFVNFEGKKKLKICFEEENLEQITKKKFEKYFENFSNQIADFIGEDLMDILQSNFSTSNQIHKTVSQIGIMTAFQNYFEYIGDFCLCGFPSITLNGTVEDYKKILIKLSSLEKFELKWWCDILKPIILKIIETKKYLIKGQKNKIDLNFWRDMIKKQERINNINSGSVYYQKKTDFISGWIIYFFPFNKNGERRDIASKVLEISNLDKNFWEIENDCKDVPGQMQCIPIKINEPLFNRTRNCFLFNGFLGFEKDKNGRMKPIVAWFLAE